MGKIVKYCAACEEGFAEKFSFCPNCGGALSAFEMKPLSSVASVPEDEPLSIPEEFPAIEAVSHEIIDAPAEPAIAAETVQTIQASPIEEAIIEQREEETIFAPLKNDPPTIEPAASRITIPKNPAASFSNPSYRNSEWKTVNSGDGLYRAEILEDGNRGFRNMLLLGSCLFVLVFSFSAVIYSIFAKDIDVAALDDTYLFTMVPQVDEIPEELDTPELKDKSPGKSGGGGGGGRNNPDPASAGRVPPQFKDKPLLTPSTEDISVTKPSLAVMRGTKGPQDYITPNQDMNKPMGVKNGPSKISDGMGDGTGIGKNGRDGVGYNGRDGYGANGDGGIGYSRGNKYGNDGPGGGGDDNDLKIEKPKPKPPPEKPAGVTSPLRITAQPRATYTDAARTANIQGVIRLRVTFLASGQIGGISVVSGLPHGLTENAIAAARNIRFEPAKANGVAQTTSKTIEYRMTIY